MFFFHYPYPFVGSTLSISEFLLQTHVVSRIFCTDLYPISHLSTHSLARVHFLYVLLVGDSIDITLLSYSHITDTYQSTIEQLGLSYGYLIQKIIDSLSISFPTFEPRSRL